VLGDVEETVYVVEEDEETEEETIRVRFVENGSEAYIEKNWMTNGSQTLKKQSEMLFVRGDSVVLISPQSS
jgi:U6 snRNA-associated Sm-like protein LSm3